MNFHIKYRDATIGCVRNLLSNDYFHIFALLIGSLYFFIGTGLHGDDYDVIPHMQALRWSEFMSPDPTKRGAMIFNLPSYYLFWWAYFALDHEHQWIYDVVKWATHVISLIFVYKFSVNYLPRNRAIIASAIFVFYPLHETTTYWYMTASYVLTPAIILYAHSLIRDEHYKLGTCLAFLGAFSNYSSPPYIFGLATIFGLERQYRKAALFVTPGVIYVAFCFIIKYVYPTVERRVDLDLGFIGFLKQLALQALSFLEASLGPSYWLKVYYAISSIGWMSAILATAGVLVTIKWAPAFSKAPALPSRSLYFGLLCVLLASFAMFALTGRYTHSAFNLGNRTTVYGSLLIAFLLALLPLNRKVIVFIAIVFVFPVFGLSDYWKSWNNHQKIVIQHIRANEDLKKLAPESTLLVSGSIYSKLGPFSHIEFFSMPWVVNAIFHDAVRSENVVALTPYVYLANGFLVDPKFGGKYSLGGVTYVYDTSADSVREVSASDATQLLAQRPKEVRHWVQLMKGTWIDRLVVALSPRLAYIFQ